MKQKYVPLYVRILRLGIGAILFLSPFYAPLAVWAARRLRHLDFFKIWKEIALTLLATVLVSFLLTHRAFAKRLFKNRLLLVMTAYLLLVTSIGLYDLLTHRVSNDAVIYGLLVDLRLIGIFVVALITLKMSARFRLPTFQWRRLTLWPALFVVTFGLLQMTVLPADILSHIGYSQSTIVPYQTVDNQPGFVRVQSTLRGANPLGAYLVVVITLLAAMLFEKSRRSKLYLGLFLVGSVVVLFGTYSRSAELGLVLSFICLLAIYKEKFVNRHTAGVLVVSIVVIVVGAIAITSNSYTAQNIIFHSSDRSNSRVSSNAERLSALKGGLEDVYHSPWGSGFGSAGPASRRNSYASERIAENYFLQVGQEVGVLGMLIFTAINVMVAYQLWLRRSNVLAKALLASLVGVTFINLVSHAWTDDTLSLIWWGLAGLAVAPHYPAAKRSLSHR